MGKEKSYPIERKHSRVLFQESPWHISLHLPQKKIAAENIFRLEAKNISPGGIKFICSSRFELHQNIIFDLLPKSDAAPKLRILGKVVRVEEVDTGFKTYGIALQFSELDEKTLSALKCSLISAEK